MSESLQSLIEKMQQNQFKAFGLLLQHVKSVQLVLSPITSCASLLFQCMFDDHFIMLSVYPFPESRWQAQFIKPEILVLKMCIMMHDSVM
jgi:hypothetical protein